MAEPIISDLAQMTKFSILNKQNAPYITNGSISNHPEDYMSGCGRLKNILYGFQPLPKQKILKLRSLNAQRCLFKYNLGQVTQQ
jgi:hypothetical protein